MSLLCIGPRAAEGGGGAYSNRARMPDGDGGVFTAIGTRAADGNGGGTLTDVLCTGTGDSNACYFNLFLVVADVERDPLVFRHPRGNVPRGVVSVFYCHLSSQSLLGSGRNPTSRIT